MLHNLSHFFEILASMLMKQYLILSYQTFNDTSQSRSFPRN
jgi:hypothetical protein